MIRRLLVALVLLTALTTVLWTEDAQARNIRGSAVIKEGKTYLGRDYRDGGLDCSMFTRRVYKKFGVHLEDSPTSQFHSGRRVRNPRRGDLVFFREHGRRLTHVGIYYGNDKILHASSYFDEVVISQMRHIDGYAGAVTF